jgi:DNA-binding beta-propeller fold protein YncE
MLASITVGSAPFGVYVDYLSNLAFVANIDDGTVAVVDGKTNTKVGSVTASSNYIDVNPVTRLVYATGMLDQLVHVISG